MGYNPSFIEGYEVNLPVPKERVVQVAFNHGKFVHHTRFSLLFNQERGFAVCTAHNVDGNSLPKSQYTSRSFKFDPKIKPNSLQVDRNRGYRDYDGNHNPWDQGHLVRRKSMSWGDPATAARCERESDVYSNIVPQHEKLHDDAWGPVEDWMMKLAEDGNKRSCVFAGTVLTLDDTPHQNGEREQPIRIPSGYWKIIVIETKGKLKAAGFLFLHSDYDQETPLEFDPVLEQVRISNIEVLTGLDFGDLSGLDPLKYREDFHIFNHASPRSADRLTRNTWNSVCAECDAAFPDFDAALGTDFDPRHRLQIRSSDDIVL